MHQLNVDPEHQPMRQKKRSFTPEHQKAIEDEANKLLEAHFIREVQYPKWLVNMVLIKKASGQWYTCIDYTTSIRCTRRIATYFLKSINS